MAVENISFRVDTNKVVAIVGESGSGKSVTALSILQLLGSNVAHTSGTILYTTRSGDQTDLLRVDDSTLRQIRGNEISMIFQEPMTSLNPLHTCGYQVAEAILTHKKGNKQQAKQKTLELFKSVELGDPVRMYDRYPHQLSGGQKQRVMIAMAMSCDPALLICDEPTTALDVTVQKTILELIKNLQRQTGMGVIFISHDLALVGEIADQIVVMYQGKIVENGLPADIFNSPQHPYTRALLACRPALYSRGQRLPVVSDFMPETANAKPSVFEVSLPVPQTANMGQPLLQVEDLHVWFPKKTPLFSREKQFIKAVDGVSFTLQKGETVGLVGESGCGKTTLGRSILHLVTPTMGTITYNGHDLTHLSPGAMRRYRKEMQIIFQDPFSSLNPRLPVGEAIGEPLLVHGLVKNQREKKEAVHELLRKVGLLPGHYTRYPHEFSGGQRQRIVIARALALQPSLIICDESVSALDVSVQAQVLNLLNDLKREFNFTALFISHDLSVVRYISDRILVMMKGKIVEEGTADDIYLRPQSPYTQRLLNSIPKGLTIS